MIEFNDDPNMSVEELQAELRRVVDQLNNGYKPIVISNMPIATTETPIAHGLGFTPRGASLCPQLGFGWRRSREADSTCVYFAASSPMTCDVIIYP